MLGSLPTTGMRGKAARHRQPTSQLSERDCTETETKRNAVFHFDTFTIVYLYLIITFIIIYRFRQAVPITL